LEKARRLGSDECAEGLLPRRVVFASLDQDTVPARPAGPIAARHQLEANVATSANPVQPDVAGRKLRREYGRNEYPAVWPSGQAARAAGPWQAHPLSLPGGKISPRLLNQLTDSYLDRRAEREVLGAVC
jgi:hypothetical protein